MACPLACTSSNRSSTLMVIGVFVLMLVCVFLSIPPRVPIVSSWVFFRILIICIFLCIFPSILLMIITCRVPGGIVLDTRGYPVCSPSGWDGGRVHGMFISSGGTAGNSCCYCLCRSPIFLWRGIVTGVTSCHCRIWTVSRCHGWNCCVDRRWYIGRGSIYL